MLCGPGGTVGPHQPGFTFCCVLQVLAQAITRGCDTPVDDYLKMTNRKKVIIRDINPKAVSTQDLYGFVNMATREWKVGQARGCRQAKCGLGGNRDRWGVLQLNLVLSLFAGRLAILHHA